MEDVVQQWNEIVIIMIKIVMVWLELMDYVNRKMINVNLRNVQMLLLHIMLINNVNLLEKDAEQLVLDVQIKHWNHVQHTLEIVKHV